MADESDEIAEAIAGQMRVAVTAAGQVGEILARARESAARRAEAASRQEARELTSRLEAEQRAARVELGSVYRSEWWDRATPEQIGSIVTTARAWSREDPGAARAEDRIRDELRTRYGIDLDSAGGDPTAIRAAVEAEKVRREAATDDRLAGVEEAEALALLHQANTADRTAEDARDRADAAPDEQTREQATTHVELHESLAAVARSDAAPLYDSAERRTAAADELRERGIEQTAVTAKMAADVSQARPATAAVGRGPVRSARARPRRDRSPRVQRTEPGR